MKDQAPIDYWSYSSLSALMSNALNFKKTYIYKVYDDMNRPSGVVGSACHKVAEAYFGWGKTEEEAIEAGYKYIDDVSDSEINYGKTGSRKAITDTFTRAIKFFFEELPTYHEIISVEQSYIAKIHDQAGQELPLPAKAKLDVVTRNELGEIEIIDYKFSDKYTDGSITDFRKFLQAMVAWHVVRETFGEAPARVIFRECKTSKNQDNTPQIQDYIIDFKDGTVYGDFATFYKLYNTCTEFVSNPNAIYLPNPNDTFNGQSSFDNFRLGIIGTEAPVAVKHKTEQVAYQDKKYVASSYDKVENQALTDEEKIKSKLQEFGIPVEMADTHVGASVTQYTLKPSRSIPMAKIAKMGNDLALALQADRVRIQAPIRGTGLVGIEVPSKVRKTIDLTESHFKKGTMEVPIGVDVYGELVSKDLAEMPHLLIAGQTGAGKSVMVNVLIKALIAQNSPKTLALVLVDPKEVELAEYSDSPFLAQPIETEYESTVKLVEDMVELMELRYKELATAKAKNLEAYNKKSKTKMKRIVFVIDEFADLMLSGGTEKRKYKQQIGAKANGTPIFETIVKPSMEELIVRLAQKARAVGIHLVLATQRPSADVVTGLIKANIPTKIAFSTTSALNSKIILDQAGAEELTGKGDMLFLDPSKRDPIRLQGLYI